MRLVIVGACGRMGEAVAKLAAARADIQIVGAVDAEPRGASLGERIGVPSLAIEVTDRLEEALAGATVMVDFSSPRATLRHLQACAQHGVAAVVGTTGHEPGFEAAIAPLCRQIPILIAANTSLGVTLLTELVRMAAKALPVGFDIEIHEAHHRHKQDAPSGTALRLGEAAAQGRGDRLERLMTAVHTRGHPRAPGTIGFSVTRGGDIVGEHAVLFAGDGESITLRHQATDRSLFARGALEAAAWLLGRAPGRYDMRDVVGLKVNLIQ